MLKFVEVADLMEVDLGDEKAKMRSVEAHMYDLAGSEKFLRSVVSNGCGSLLQGHTCYN